MKSLVNEKGYFGDFGGSFVPPQLQKVLDTLEKQFYECIQEPEFMKELDYQYQQYIGRPNPLFYAKKLSEKLGGGKIFLKREDLNHTGSHKINNTIGQVLLAKQMGLKRVIAETGAGQHGVATATAAALFDMECIIYMGEEDTKRQALNVYRMQLLGAKVNAVKSGTRTLKDAVDEALNDLIENYDHTYYMLGSVVGPHPYPMIVRYFQSIIGREAREQVIQQAGRLPDYVMACVGGGSNAIGLFSGFIADENVKIIGVEPGGHGISTGRHAAPLSVGKPGMIHGFKCHVLCDEEGKPLPTHSVAAGLDYPGVGPEHSHLKESGRANYVSVTDDEALNAFQELSKVEGIIPALESAHAIAYAIKLAPTLDSDQIIIINLSGRGDKDVAQVYDILQSKENN
ncbi:MAG: tryptophan synthase subunit beta [Desulfitibacter sp. BRH_c19]|nr:MAG: tryptophan synthase subunit beta [Desulfitibacter sp. BRH_c19]